MSLENLQTLWQPWMASIRLDDTSTGMRNDFDKAVAYLLPIAEGNKKDPTNMPMEESLN